MPYIRTTTRLEPHARDRDMERGVQARVHDPLWLLGRQWQWGEFQGEDVASLIGARIVGDHDQITRFHPGPLRTATWSEPAVLGGDLASGPAALVTDEGTLHVVYAARSGQLRHRRYDGAEWSPVRPAGRGDDVRARSRPALVTTGGDGLAVFMVDRSGRLQRTDWNGIGWSAWRSLTQGLATIDAAPAAVAVRGEDETRIELFVLDAGDVLRRVTVRPDEPLEVERRDDLVLAGAPVAASSGDRVDAFAPVMTPQSGARSIRHFWSEGGGEWSEEAVAVSAETPLAAATHPGGPVHLMTVTDGRRLRHRSTRAGRWSAPEPLGTHEEWLPLTLVAPAPDWLEALRVWGPGRWLEHRRFRAGRWSDWTRLEGPGLLLTPDAAVRGRELHALAARWARPDMPGAAQPLEHRMRRLSLGVPYDPERLPLETVAERERVEIDPGRHAASAAEAGLHFLRLLEHLGDGPDPAADSRDIIRSHFPLDSPDSDPTLDRATAGLLSVMAGRAPNGHRLYRELGPGNRYGTLESFLTEFQIPSDERDGFAEAVEAWLEWYENRFSEPDSAAGSWIAERLEYGFAVGAPSEDPEDQDREETVLTAREYTGGHLDWFSFTHEPEATIGAAGDAPTPARARTLLPAPVSFHGMPAPRWWEMEDSTVDLGAIDTAPEDLSRMILAEFALSFGNDWFVVPLELNVGSIFRIRMLQVRNTFGEVTTVCPVSAKTSDAPWRMFELTTADVSEDEADESTSEPTEPENAEECDDDARSGLFFLAPALPDRLESDPLEEVRFIRDEMANLAWGIERTAQGPSGRPLSRHEAYQQLRERRREAEPEPQVVEGAEVRYCLATRVPDYWIPLVPHGRDDRQMLFQRGVLLNTETGHVGAPWGRVLEAGLTVHEEEVPRAGAQVTRTFQRARWIHGSTYLWIGRRKLPGRGEGSSGLRFDVVKPVEGS